MTYEKKERKYDRTFSIYFLDACIMIIHDMTKRKDNQTYLGTNIVGGVGILYNFLIN